MQEMPKESRSKKAIKNIVYGASMQLLYIALNFISRSIFIHFLNTDYLGVNSLYSNILTVLSFAELGIGNAIIFSLYEPISKNDTSRIQAIMKLYSISYKIVGIVVFILGLLFIPFMGYIIKDAPDIKENLIFIYILFLFNTSLSYFFSYKKSIITADQKDYLVQIYTRLFQFLQIILQTIFLIITHAYLPYLIMQIICTFLLNYSLSLKADVLYPFIKEKNNNRLNKKETKNIFENVKALFVYKFGSVILNGTDNIIISALFNVRFVGLTSNYTMIISNVTNVIGQAINALTPSVGNLVVEADKEKIRDVMHQLLFLCVWLYGFLAIILYNFSNFFIELWLGSEYLLNQFVVFALVFSLYVNGVQYAAYTFRTTQGLFIQSRFVPILSAIINIVLSVWWGKKFGVAGVFIATGISRLVTTTLVDPWLVYKNNFNEKPIEYYKKYFIGTVVVLVNGGLQALLSSFFPLHGWGGLLFKLIIISFTTNLLFLLAFGKTYEFISLKGRIEKRFRRVN